MKKIELHVHLDGSLRPCTVAELLNMDENEVKERMVVKDNNADLKEYLTKFDLPIRAMQTKENLIRVTKELVEDLKKDNIIYAEVRFAPIFHIKEKLSLEEVVESVLEGIKNANGIKINLILCMMRESTYEENLNVIKLAEKYLNKGVVALDLAGDEKKYKTINYKDLFLLAKEKNIPFTIHAGEADTSKSVMDAIMFGAKRIGHGINIIDDEMAMKKVKEEGIFLEVCPTSNVQTKAVLSYQKHPVKKLFEKGILVTISTDNNTVSNLTLSKEYNNLSKNFGFTKKDFFMLNVAPVLASFTSASEKEKLINLLKEDYDKNIYSKAWTN